MADLKAVYTAPNEENAYQKLIEFEEKWVSLYPTCVKSWKDNWHVISPFFSYSKDIRKIMYTTNIIENLNRYYQKVAKGKPVFPTNQSLLKALYLATQNTTKKWTNRQHGWDLIKNELSIMHDSSSEI